MKNSLNLPKLWAGVCRLVLVSCFFFTALMHGEVAMAMGAGGMKDVRDQGIHYYRQGRMGQARSNLEEAYQTKEGKKDYRTLIYLARIYYDQADIGSAVSMAEDAVEVSSNDSERQEAIGFLEGIRELFGSVIVAYKGAVRGKAPSDVEVLEGFLHIEDLEGLIAVEKKEAYDKIRARQLEQKVKLPLVLYLPAGTYKINGVEVALSATEAPDKVEVELWESVPGELIAAQLAAGIGAEGARKGESGWFARNWKVAALGGGALVAAGTAVGLGFSSKGYADKAHQEYHDRYIVASNPDDVIKSREVWEEHRANANSIGSAAWAAGGVSVALIGAATVWAIVDASSGGGGGEAVASGPKLPKLAAIPTVSASDFMFNLQYRW